MPQVINPQVQEDDFGRNLAAGLQIYATVKDFRSKSSMTSATSNPNDVNAMRRRSETNQGAIYGSG